MAGQRQPVSDSTAQVKTPREGYEFFHRNFFAFDKADHAAIVAVNLCGVPALTGVLGKPGTGMLPGWCPEDGMIAERCLALGASTPWKRIRCKRGCGTNAASRRMNSSGDITI